MKRKGTKSSDAPLDTPRIQALDLGLSSLVSGQDSQTQESAPPAPVAEVVDSGAALKELAKANQFEVLASSESWADLLTLCEQQSSQEGAVGLEARLWWVRCQLQLKTVPPGILAAPLENTTKVFIDTDPSALGLLPAEERARLSHLAASILLETGKALGKGHETDVAISMLERAYRLDGSGATALRRILNEEIARRRKALTRFSNDDEKETLERLQTLRRELPESGFVLGGDGGSEAGRGSEDARTQTRTNLRNVAILSLLILIAAGGLVYLGLFSGDGSQREFAAFEEVQDKLLQGASSAHPLVPVTGRLTGMGQLDAVFYELNGKKAESRTVAVEPTVAAPPVSAPAASRQKEVINTTSPVESEIASSQPRQQPASSVRQARAAPGPARSGYDAEPDEPQPMGIETFVNPRNYLIPRHVEVRSKPSLFATVVDSLFPGDKVKVDGRVGKWLVLRSQQGRLGYIPAKDAEEMRH